MHQNPTPQHCQEVRSQTKDTGRESSEPDYILEGHVFDCYSPEPGTRARNVWSTVRDKIEDRQTQRVILNLQEWKPDISTLHRQFNDWHIPGLKEVKALTRDHQIISLPIN